MELISLSVVCLRHHFFLKKRSTWYCHSLHLENIEHFPCKWAAWLMRYILKTILSFQLQACFISRHAPIKNTGFYAKALACQFENWSLLDFSKVWWLAMFNVKYLTNKQFHASTARHKYLHHEDWTESFKIKEICCQTCFLKTPKNLFWKRVCFSFNLWLKSCNIVYTYTYEMSVTACVPKGRGLCNRNTYGVYGTCKC